MIYHSCSVAVILVSLIKLCSDLDQLNHILGILGSPSQDDLQCIMNEKVTIVRTLISLNFL